MLVGSHLLVKQLPLPQSPAVEWCVTCRQTSTHSNHQAMALLGLGATPAEKLHLDLGRLRLGSQQAESQPATPSSSACKVSGCELG